MKIEVNIDKKYAFLILGVLLVVGAGLFVYAYGGGSPSVMGHSAGEVEITLPNGTSTTLQNLIVNGWATTHNESRWVSTWISVPSSGTYNLTTYVPSGVKAIQLTARHITADNAAVSTGVSVYASVDGIPLLDLYFDSAVNERLPRYSSSMMVSPGEHTFAGSSTLGATISFYISGYLI